MKFGLIGPGQQIEARQQDEPMLRALPGLDLPNDQRQSMGITDD